MMAVISTGYVGIAILLGKLVDVVGKSIEAVEREDFLQKTLVILASMAAIYVVRELLNVLRRILVESTCTRLNCDIQRQVIEHVIKFDMETLGSQRLGALHGRIFRCVDGLIHFVRLMFLECLPAIFIGLFAMTTSIFKEPTLGLIMLGVVPISLMLTLKQLNKKQETWFGQILERDNLQAYSAGLAVLHHPNVFPPSGSVRFLASLITALNGSIRPSLAIFSRS